MAFMGYVDTETAIPDVLNVAETQDMAGVGDWLDYPGPLTGLVLPKPLPPGYAAVFSFRLAFDDATSRYAAREGQRINISLSFDPYTAYPLLMGLFTGNLLTS
jgi:hypothetical protein